MAGNKVNAKAKGKDDRGKGSSKSIVPNNDDSEDPDFSLLRKPIQTSITGFAQAREIFDVATEELKGLLSDECDLLYECKVCRNLFRSLANFISHKRVYCQNKFNSTVHGHFIDSSSTINELTKIKRIEEGYQDSLKEIDESIDVEVEDRIPLTKDLTTIVEKIAKNKGISESADNNPQVTLHKIPSSAIAVFQNIDTDEKESENMRNQVTELDDILSRNIAVLQSDGKFKIESSIPNESAESNTEAVIQISDDEEGSTDSLKCKKCDMRFSTQKTLKFHMKYKHVDTRVVYPCPDCLEIFSTSWSVYRHLFKVHRKSAAQIRRLRESIQAKAFKMNNPPAFYEKRRNMKTAPVPKITEEERLDQENQAWMDNIEWAGEVPRCLGCGRAFERRAALAAHTHTCQPRSRALRRPDKRIEIQIRKDYHKGPRAHTDLNDNKTIKPDIKESKEETEEEEKPKTKTTKDPETDVIPEQIVAKEPSPDIAIQETNEPESKSSSVSPEKVEVEVPKAETQPEKPVRLPFAQHAEKSNLMALRQRIIPDIELENLRCKKCDARCDHIQQLYDHVAKHYNWMRYACKLCNFKHYNFEKLPEHVKVVHKLKGDKDFYFSTVKALDGTEAAELAAPVEESPEADESSSNSRRPSRCSSDSSRLSDDSSSSSTRLEGAKKRKMSHKIQSKGISKRRKSFKGSREADEDWTDKDDSSNAKIFEENSSDIDDTYERISKKHIEESVASRRPVRRKAKPKNEDFEYDLSNLLKMEAQGYRESQTVTTTSKSSLTKKKVQSVDSLSNYEMMNKECCGALVSLSRKVVENAKAHMKTSTFLYIAREKVPSSIFARPMLPKGLTRGEKLSPKKEAVEEKKDPEKEKDNPSSNKEINKENSLEKNITDIKKTDENDVITSVKQGASTVTSNDLSKKTESDVIVTSGSTTTAVQKKDSVTTTAVSSENPKPKSISIPSVLPLKFRRQSIDVIKNNPIINKNISEFTKAGMKTKILVIKPINRKKDGIQAVNTPLKFQTIKLKETCKSFSSEDKLDQVVVVKVPKVDRITRTVAETTKVASDNISAIKRTERTLSAPEEPMIGLAEAHCSDDPPKSIKIHEDKNGDVKFKIPEPMEIESVKSDDAKLKSDINDKASCDNNTVNSVSETKNVVIAAETSCNVSEKVDDS